MTGLQAIAFLLPTLFLTACGKSRSGDAEEGAPLEPARLTAATLGEQVVLPTGDYLQLPRYAEADLETGQRLAMQCRACHSFDADGPNLIGPNLHDFFGRPVASTPGYGYSPALRAADFIWTPDALDAWLAQPATFLPGNRMAYAGLADRADRDAVIAALLRLTTASNEDSG